MQTTTPDLRTPVRDRLRLLYGAPGPFVSVYLECGEFALEDEVEAFERHRPELEAQGASPASLDAVTARLRLPAPSDSGGRSVHAGADGTTIAMFSPEGPRSPLVRVDALPVVAPLVEWGQWQVPHLVVLRDPQVAEVVTFLPDVESRIAPVAPDPMVIADLCRRVTHDEGIRLIVIAGDASGAEDLESRLAGMLPPETRLIMCESDVAGPTADALANTVVRHVADVVARDIVRRLEQFRFMRRAGGVAEGVSDVLNALAAGDGTTLLVHDDPAAMRPGSFGSSPTEISPDPRRFAHVARAVDIAIWSAFEQGLDIEVIPSTGPGGPAEEIGLLRRLADGTSG